MSDKKKEYKVGYRKPPASRQFKSGQSGNPNGRPKGSKNLATEIEAELATIIEITENGKRKQITKCQAIAKQIVNKAASGDHKALPILMNHTKLQDANSGYSQINDQIITKEDVLVMDSIIKRIRDLEYISENNSVEDI